MFLTNKVESKLRHVCFADVFLEDKELNNPVELQ